MKKLQMSAVVGALAVFATSLTIGTLGTGTAAADPDPSLDPFVNTTCTYDQVMAAVNAQSPAAAAAFGPKQRELIHIFLAAPPEKRREYAAQVRSLPQNRPILPLIERVFATCNNF
ncbi:MAG: hemophore-related protein [Mycolicibacterium hassiacum]|jgi:hemophore-related protein|uniref:hemophore-related protein n=1 Tax=Mycolicibacterium hassiacum TaxID=46351 RepID=UPI0023F92D6F|nr:hemophore-related protein [Mycolicibacterium hassiacum]MBX5487801.1 hemophore-related protein [Mycolicibacterium hassiacum]